MNNPSGLLSFWLKMVSNGYMNSRPQSRMRENKAFYIILHLLPNAGKGEGWGQLRITELLTFDQSLALALKVARF